MVPRRASSDTTGILGMEIPTRYSPKAMYLLHGPSTTLTRSTVTVVVIQPGELRLHLSDTPTVQKGMLVEWQQLHIAFES